MKLLLKVLKIGILTTWCWVLFDAVLAKMPEVPTLHEVIANKQVNYKAVSKGGFYGEVLKVDFQNLTQNSLEFKIEAGTQFDSDNEWQQNLVVVREVIVKMIKKERKTVELYVACTQIHFASPIAGATFTLFPKDKNHLWALLQMASESGYYTSTALQSAVWSITDDSSIENIYDVDSFACKRMREFVCTVKGIAPCDLHVLPRPHRIFSVQTSLECLLPDYVKQAALRAYNRRGQCVRTYWKEQTLQPGFYQFKVGIYHYESDTSTFVLRLETPEKVLFEKIASPSDIIIPVRRVEQETILTYEVPEEITARVAIYDSAENLYALLADNYKLIKGFHQSILSKTRELPVGISYFLKVINQSNGKVVVSKKIRIDKEEQQKHPLITRRGILQIELKHAINNAKLAIYDAENQIVWVVFENSYLTHGFKSYPYVFQHDAGENAYFVARITDEEGKIIAEKCVQGCTK